MITVYSAGLPVMVDQNTHKVRPLATAEVVDFDDYKDVVIL